MGGTCCTEAQALSIAGIVVASVIILVVIALVVVVLRCHEHRHRHQHHSRDTSNNSSLEEAVVARPSFIEQSQRV